MKTKNNIRNIGIVAHADAGKTTLTEQLLYKSGSSHTLGSVDKGTTHTDSMEIEKQRGISVKASEIDFTWKNTRVYLIDTPGHIDFSAEVQRSIGVLDGAVVVLSSVEGVQPQAEVYFKALKEMKTPTIFFINKLDRIGSDPNQTASDIKKLLTDKVIPLQTINETDNSFTVKNIFEILNTFDMVKDIKDASHMALIEPIIDILGDNNEELIQKYFEGSLSINEIKEDLKLQANKGLIFPILFGTAIKGEGILELLDSILDYLPGPLDNDSKELSALVYKISHHRILGKICHIKLFSGELETRDEVYNVKKDKKDKISLMKKIINQKVSDINHAFSGELVMVSGLSSFAVGDILGCDAFIPKLPILAAPLLTLKVHTKKDDDYIPLIEALNILQVEDPLLNMVWVKEKKEIHLQIMGTIQLEVLESVLKERFNIEVTTGKASVIYKETPISSGLGEERYTMPKPCWAIVAFYIEPLLKGSGIIYETKVKTENVKLKFQKEIENSIESILEQGVHGWKVTDLKITFIEGEDHVMHSRSGDFAAATAMALIRGLTQIGTTLLEPMLRFRISVPEEISSKLLNDIIQMRGTFDTPVIHNGIFTVEGRFPVATSLEYSINLAAISSGRGIMSTRFDGYEPCPLELGASRERIGVNPLDRAKYIMHVRNAL